jgi:DNA-binding SARP family transcriptional activator
MGGIVAEFRILGLVEAVHDGSVIPLGGPRHRRLLAVLALQPGQVVPAGKLVDALWGDAPPRSAPAMLHVRVSELRTALRAAGTRLLNQAGGYLLGVDRDGIDAGQFERLAAAGAAALAGGDPHRARADLAAALALWRGPALAEFADEPFARSEVSRLGELRLHVVENRIAADLDLGRHGEVVAELEKLVAEHPLRERFWVQLMLALYGTGRPGEALQAYQAARRLLADQLGLDPGEALRTLHHSILTADPALTVVRPAEAAEFEAHAVAVRTRPVPAQLPSDVPAFTGRSDQLRRLDEMLADRGPGPAVAVAVVSGTPGVGKTALAVHWAHRVRGMFPDGQLYVNLRGYDPGQPLTAAGALARLLSALGVAGEEIPVDSEERAVRYRTEIAGRRILLVLDNASSVEQVRPLLPGTATCAVVLTSRDSMAGLVARDGAYRLDLDLLPPGDAHALLRRLIGRRAAAEPEAVAALADCCARLPIALRVAAELAVSRPGTPLSTLVEELADQQGRLDLLAAGGDPRAAVPTVFSWSIRHLPQPAAATFPLLGLHPGADLDAYAAAALAGTDLATARRTLDTLARAHLLHPTLPGRYGMHDLLRAYAASLARQADPAAALSRLFDYYLAAAAAAIDRLYPIDARRRPAAVAAPATPVPDLAGPHAARAWLDAERQTMVAVAGHAARHGWPDHSVRLSMILFRYLDGGHNLDALAIHEYARRAAERSGDTVGQAEALNGLGVVHLRLGRYGPATGHLKHGLALFRRAGNPLGQARALGNVAIAEQLQGDYRRAADHLERALRLYRQVGDRVGEARSINDLGILEQRLGRYLRAADRHAQALALLRAVGDPSGEAVALNNLGEVEQRLGRRERAIHYVRQSLELARSLGDRTAEAWALNSLGAVHTSAGRTAEATGDYRAALDIFRQVGDRDGEPRALNGLGEATQAAGRPADALTHHTAALALALANNAPDEQARAHAGLGHAHAGLGRPEQARHHYEQAAARYDSLDAPEAASVRARLAGLAQRTTVSPGSGGTSAGGAQA